MIEVTYNIVYDGGTIESTNTRKFKDTDELYEWQRSQEGHPFLYIEIVKTDEVNK